MLRLMRAGQLGQLTRPTEGRLGDVGTVRITILILNLFL